MFHCSPTLFRESFHTQRSSMTERQNHQLRPGSNKQLHGATKNHVNSVFILPGLMPAWMAWRLVLHRLGAGKNWLSQDLVSPFMSRTAVNYTLNLAQIQVALESMSVQGLPDLATPLPCCVFFHSGIRLQNWLVYLYGQMITACLNREMRRIFISFPHGST